MFPFTRSYGFAFVLSLALSLCASACTRGESLPGADEDTGVGFGLPDSGTLEDTRPPPFRDGGTGPCGDESCGNGLDDDCDGVVDNGCFCLPGDESACFGGEAESRGVGVCVDGVITCEDGLEFGTWSDCEGDVLRGEEGCDGSLDDDCDGAIDEGCVCTPGAGPIACGSDVGRCVTGTQLCVDAMLGECEDSTGPIAETCDGTDEDCDGTVDEGLVRTCGSDVGECAMGTETCIDGTWDTCAGGRSPDVEVCNGLDDDCDGSADETLVRDCGSVVGACLAGTQTCTAAMWTSCTGETTPVLEACNGADDDCDGTTDESLMRVCGTDLGACRVGTESCVSGAWSCSGDIAPSSEVCEGSIDEDCDGVVDNGCGCSTGDTRTCGSDVGRCRTGTETCDASGAWGACAGERAPVAELCNGQDDDCDGAVDDGLTRTCGTDIGACSIGSQTCAAGSWGACGGSTGPSAEVCEGSVDENCDGTVDEGCGCSDGDMRPCGTGIGPCVLGSQTCSGATWGACLGGIGPTPEICNFRDDDCDGVPDELLPRVCGSDIGVCTVGTERCSRGVWTMCTGVGASAELCEGVNDENCDGVVDDGCACTDGDTRGCGTDVGECEFGTELCDLTGTWGACLGGVGMSPETCNTLDDDCDGAVDDGVCVFLPPVVTCPIGITAAVLSTVTLSSSGSDPDGGAVTYSWTVTSRPLGSTANPASPTSATTTFFLDGSGTFELEFCATDDEGDTTCCSVTVISEPPGTIHVEVTWDQPYGDVDAHFLNVTRIPEDGWFTSDDCYWSNTAPDWGPLGVAGNPVLDRDETGGFGPENITMDVSPASGSYHVGVHYYCDDTLGATDATVRVFCMGTLIATYSGLTLSSTDDWITVARVDYPSCVGASVNNVTNGSSILPPAATTVRHCVISCTSDPDCPTGEMCDLGTGVCVLM